MVVKVRVTITVREESTPLPDYQEARTMGYLPPPPPPAKEICAACEGTGLILPGEYLGELRKDAPARKCMLCGGKPFSGIRPSPQGTYPVEPPPDYDFGDYRPRRKVTGFK